MFLPEAFAQGGSTKDGLLLRVRGEKMEVYGCASHPQALFWRYNHVLLAFGREELYFDYV